jgi:hypothetical protein
MEDFLWDPVQYMEERESVLKYSSSGDSSIHFF